MNEVIFTESGFLTSRDKSGVMVSLSNHARKGPSPCINARHSVQSTTPWFDKLTFTPAVRFDTNTEITINKLVTTSCTK